MAQRKREAKLDSRSSRASLNPSGKPYYRLLRPKLHLGYRKGRIGSRWVARVHLGNGRYLVETIASADDRADSNGTGVLAYVEAQRAAELIFSRMTGIEIRNKRLTVATILEDYFLQLEFEGRCTRDARNRADMHKGAPRFNMLGDSNIHGSRGNLVSDASFDNFDDEARSSSRHGREKLLESRNHCHQDATP